MSEMDVEHDKLANDDKHTFKIKSSQNSNETSGNDKSAKNLGEGRWKYQGKTYKEQSIGKN
jgi:hypothetical protein